MKIVHAADLHLDSPLRGLARYQGAPVERLRNATREAMQRLVELCCRERAELLLLAGDLFDGHWRDYSTGLFFLEQLARLRDAGVQVVSVRGNHDFQSAIARELRWPDNVHELPSRKAGTLELPGLDVVVHGQSFGERDVRDDLASRYPDPVPGAFNVGLLHTSLTGREGHDSYAPTTLEVLRAKGYDYWALGHVHAREVVCSEPWVVYPGNLQGRHARETGPKGATLMTIERGRCVDVAHEPLDVVRWTQCKVDARAASDVHDVVDLAREALRAEVAAAEGRLLAARVVIEGATRAHAALLRDPAEILDRLRGAAVDVAPDAVWLEKLELRTVAPQHQAALAVRKDALGELLDALDQTGGDEAEVASLVAVLAELKKKLPAEVMRGEDGIRLDDPAFVTALLPEVRELLLAAVLDGEPS